MLLTFVTVPVSIFLALIIAVALNSIKWFQKALQTVFFLPYVTNTIAIGMVFSVIFDKQGIINSIFNLTAANGTDPFAWIYGADPRIAMIPLCIYIVWNSIPFKILILTGALASVKEDLYKAAKIDSTPKWRVFTRITLPMISPMIFYLVITGFIGAFKAYSDSVALFGTDLNVAGMNTVVGYIYDMLYGNSGGYPSYASAAALILFVIVLTITCINLMVSKKSIVKV